MVALTIFFGAIIFFAFSYASHHGLHSLPFFSVSFAHFSVFFLVSHLEEQRSLKRKTYFFFSDLGTTSLSQIDSVVDAPSSFPFKLPPCCPRPFLPPHAPKCHHRGSSTVFRNRNLHLCPLKRSVRFHPRRLSQDLTTYSLVPQRPLSPSWIDVICPNSYFRSLLPNPCSADEYLC